MRHPETLERADAKLLVLLNLTFVSRPGEAVREDFAACFVPRFPASGAL
jgi:hypothetical protein